MQNKKTKDKSQGARYAKALGNENKTCLWAGLKKMLFEAEKTYQIETNKTIRKKACQDLT